MHSRLSRFAGLALTTCTMVPCAAGAAQPTSESRARNAPDAVGAGSAELNRVVQWQILAKDPDAVSRFYATLFGWTIVRGRPSEQLELRSGALGGLPGGVWPSPPDGHSFVQLFVEVSDIGVVTRRAEELGGAVLVPAQRLPDGDEVAILRGPEGVSFGLVQRSRAVRQLVAAKAGLMAADYRADLAGLARLRDEVALWRRDPGLGYLADYWSGYAGWRLAMNGASAGMSRSDLEAHLRRAAADFEASFGANDRFADAYAAAASVHGWLLTFHLGEPELRKFHGERSAAFLARAKELEPGNPRVLWVEGGNLLLRPREYGGDVERGMATYRTIVATAGPLSPDSPLPDWGKVEAIMSLAYGHLNQPAPDLEAAIAAALEALRLEPDWHYVRNVLLPRIEERRAQAAETGDRP